MCAGGTVWKYSDFVLDRGYPKLMTRLPADMDAALYLERNKKLVFIKVGGAAPHTIHTILCCPLHQSVYTGSNTVSLSVTNTVSLSVIKYGLLVTNTVSLSVTNTVSL